MTQIKYQDGEDFESWSQRVCAHEKAQALDNIHHGADPEQELEAMSHRVTKKLLYPVLHVLKSQPSNFDATRNRAEYDAIMDRVKLDQYR